MIARANQRAVILVFKEFGSRLKSTGIVGVHAENVWSSHRTLVTASINFKKKEIVIIPEQAL